MICTTVVFSFGFGDSLKVGLITGALIFCPVFARVRSIDLFIKERCCLELEERIG